jgi:hypothetical protein
MTAICSNKGVLVATCCSGRGVLLRLNGPGVFGLETDFNLVGMGM